MHFAKFCPPVSKNEIANKIVKLNPLKRKQKTLIFDLDETLIHCNESLDI
jgi:hypothetical protein